MSNDIAPKSPVSEFLDKVNLPHLLAGEAGKAISRLIGEGIEYPAAWLNRLTQGVKDGTEARSLATKSISEAVAKRLSNDPAIVDRAAESFLAKELRKQVNKEAIAERTLAILEKQEKVEPTQEAPPPLDEDWLNVFGRYAEEASSERLRQLFAKILAGEIRKPNSFSLRTLRFISELDQSVATLFEKYSQLVVSSQFILTQKMSKGSYLADLLALEEAELITGAAGTLSQNLELNEQPLIFSLPDARFIFAEGTTVGKFVRLKCVVLTKVGREIYTVLKPHFNEEAALQFAESLPKEHLREISLKTIISTSQGMQFTTLRILWSKDQHDSGPAIKQQF